MVSGLVYLIKYLHWVGSVERRLQDRFIIVETFCSYFLLSLVAVTDPNQKFLDQFNTNGAQSK